MILAAEDNPDDAMLLSYAFKKANLPCKLIMTGNGEETVRYLEKASTGSQVPRLILLDLLMPMLDGFGVLQWIQNDSRFVTIPVVALSGSVCPTHQKEALRLGAREFVAKASDREEIIRMLQYLYGRYMAEGRGVPLCLGKPVAQRSVVENISVPAGEGSTSST